MTRIGTSGFSFKSWRGQVYPPSLPMGKLFDYYVQVLGFDSVELNYTFYTQPSPKTMESLLRRSPENFDFAAKMHRSITHEKESPDTKRNLDTFIAGISPLKDSGKLGCLLAQFPPGFLPSRASINRILRLREWSHPIPVAFEFRHKAWFREDVSKLLKEEDLCVCAADLPELGSLPPFQPVPSSSQAYFRLHGRNKNWYSNGSRYDYVYSESELRSFLPQITACEGNGITVRVFFNNCHAGHAARSAVLMQNLLNEAFPGLCPRVSPTLHLCS
jgi:uncharacterized protein YecE (DUF72 family)